MKGRHLTAHMADGERRGRLQHCRRRLFSWYLCVSQQGGCPVFATGCQCSSAAVITRGFTPIHGGWSSFIYLFQLKSRNDPRGPSRGCLLFSNIIIMFVCVWWSCVCVLSADSQLYAFIKTLPSVSTATSFSLLLFYNFTYHPHLILQGGVSILSLFSHFQLVAAR